MMCRRLPLLSLLAAVVALNACATIYQSKPIHGHVVDADTGEPLEDVVILVDWRLSTASGNDAGSLALQEAVSDEDGAFEIPALPPTRVPEGSAPGIRLPTAAPDLLFFKPGYRWLLLVNPGAAPAPEDPAWTGPHQRESAWNAKKLELTKFEGDLRSYSEHVSRPFRGTTGCGFKQAPAIHVALFGVRERLVELGIANSVISIADVEEQARGHDCGSVRNFFEPFMK